MNNRRATIPCSSPNLNLNRRSQFRATSIHPLIEDVPNVTYVTVTPREPSPTPPPLPPKLRQQPKERLPPKESPPPRERPPRERPPRETLIEPQTQTVYINSSNGYIDKEVSKLRIRVNQLEHELQTIKKLLEKQNKENK